MNAKEASEMLGITYGQLRYLVERIDAITKKETSQGHAHDFNFQDLLFLKLAAMIRADKIRLDFINEAILLLEEAMKIHKRIHGTLIYRPDIYKNWFPQDIFIEPLATARWMWTPADFEWREGTANFNKQDISYVDHIPGTLYSVSGILRELTRNDQMQLEFKQRKEVYEET